MAGGALAGDDKERDVAHRIQLLYQGQAETSARASTAPGHR